ncbi:hypothetical protein C8J57DRAFT_1294157 [Mycena rebaudengoi]|nr:hypothetical protein C8J57DRAFT_1294157 [Mycena rebaudengoi]
MAMPPSLLLLNCLSLILAFLTLAISSLDHGILSLWMNSAASILTIIYHGTLLWLSRNRPERSAMCTVPAITLAFLLSSIWLAAFAVMVIIAYGTKDGGQVDVFSLNIQFPASVQDAQQVQLILVSMEFSLLGDLAIRSMLQRRHLVKSVFSVSWLRDALAVTKIQG